MQALLTNEEIVRSAHKRLQDIEAELESGSFARVQASRNLHAIVDPEMYSKVAGYRWYSVISRGGHIYPVADVSGKRVSLGRLIVVLSEAARELENTKHVSFENKCAFDCRLANLRDRVGRVATMRNRKVKRGSSSRFKGVRAKELKDGNKCYSASIAGEFGRIGLGTYRDEEYAARVYDAAAWLLFEGASLPNVTKEVPSLEHLEIAAWRIKRMRQKQSSEAD